MIARTTHVADDFGAMKGRLTSADRVCSKWLRLKSLTENYWNVLPALVYQQLMRWVVWGCLLVACGSSDEIEVDRSRCTQLRDLLVDLRLKDAKTVDVVAHRKAMKRALDEEFIATCAERMSPGELRCALGARELGVAIACSAAKHD